jgi:hypothetical protein
MKKLIVVAVSMLLLGCNENSRRNIDIKNDMTIVIDNRGQTATKIHKDSARLRAGVYIKLAEEFEAGQIKTVNEAVEFSSPLFSELSKKYTEDINLLRKIRLHDADDQLPEDSAKTFRLFAKEYADAAR